MVKTDNEKRLLRFLIRHFAENYSINQLAKQLDLTPKGMHKLLKRLEQQGIVKPQRMANAVFYKINFNSDLARKSVELSLFEEIEQPFARVQAKDFERLRPMARAAVLFGSVLVKGEKAEDIDIMVILEKKKYHAFQKELGKLKAIKTKRIHSVIQLPEDFAKNLQKRDKVLFEILKAGKILWGQEVIVEAIMRMAES